jgi:lipopolysaccharide export LptBFGC system permease protein LptF
MLIQLFVLALVFCLIVFMLIPMLPMQERGKQILTAIMVVIAILVLLGWVGVVPTAWWRGGLR